MDAYSLPAPFQIADTFAKQTRQRVCERGRLGSERRTELFDASAPQDSTSIEQLGSPDPGVKRQYTRHQQRRLKAQQANHQLRIDLVQEHERV